MCIGGDGVAEEREEEGQRTRRRRREKFTGLYNPLSTSSQSMMCKSTLHRLV